MSDDDLMTGAELLAFLRIDARNEAATTWALRRRGLPYIQRPGVPIRYSRAAVRAWLDEGGRADAVEPDPNEEDE